MAISRRKLLTVHGAGIVAAGLGCASVSTGPTTMYGLIGRINAVAGQRDALARILLDGVAGMPGCRSYVVATDPAAPDSLWITEVWESKEAHRASLALPSVQRAIAAGRPLIVGFGERFETTPLGGHGLAT
jgi:quinol monooxygenase YgiN